MNYRASNMRPIFTPDHSLKESMHLMKSAGLRSFFPDGIRPRQFVDKVNAYKIVEHQNRGEKKRITLIASISRDRIFQTFLSIIGALKDDVSMKLHGSHRMKAHENAPPLKRKDLYRPIAESWLLEDGIEDLVTHDGCTSITLKCKGSRVRLDEHKLLQISGKRWEMLEAMLIQQGILRDDRIRTVETVPHFHYTSDAFENTFEKFKTLVMADDWQQQQPEDFDDDDFLSV